MGVGKYYSSNQEVYHRSIYYLLKEISVSLEIIDFFRSFVDFKGLLGTKHNLDRGIVHYIGCIIVENEQCLPLWATFLWVCSLFLQANWPTVRISKLGYTTVDSRGWVGSIHNSKGNLQGTIVA